MKQYKNPKKLAWLRSFNTCCLSGRQGVEVSHLHENEWSGMGRKVSDVLVLPMAAELHAAQHKYGNFWDQVLPGGIPESKDWAARLDDIWEARDLEGAERLFLDMQDRANRSFLRYILEKAA